MILGTKLRDSVDLYRKEKTELDEQLVKDKYSLDVLQTENI